MNQIQLQIFSLILSKKKNILLKKSCISCDGCWMAPKMYNVAGMVQYGNRQILSGEQRPKDFYPNIKASITAVNSDQNQSRVRADIPRRSPPLGIYMYMKVEQSAISSACLG